MEARTVNSPLPTVSRDETIRCLLAIELSKKSWIVAVNTPLADKVSRHTLEACDWKGLLELIARMRTRVIQTLNRPVEVVSCYEAGYDGFWLHRLLEAHGVRNYVIDPASVQVNRRARRVKTDNIDVGRLLRSLMAYLRGEPKVWSVLRVPSVTEEDDRRLHRERDRLINERVPQCCMRDLGLGSSPTGYKLMRRVSHRFNRGPPLWIQRIKCNVATIDRRTARLKKDA